MNNDFKAGLSKRSIVHYTAGERENEKVPWYHNPLSKRIKDRWCLSHPAASERSERHGSVDRQKWTFSHSSSQIKDWHLSRFQLSIPAVMLLEPHSLNSINTQMNLMNPVKSCTGHISPQINKKSKKRGNYNEHKKTIQIFEIFSWQLKRWLGTRCFQVKKINKNIVIQTMLLIY